MSAAAVAAAVTRTGTRSEEQRRVMEGSRGRGWGRRFAEEIAEGGLAPRAFRKDPGRGTVRSSRFWGQGGHDGRARVTLRASHEHAPRRARAPRAPGSPTLRGRLAAAPRGEPALRPRRG